MCDDLKIITSYSTILVGSSHLGYHTCLLKTHDCFINTIVVVYYGEVCFVKHHLIVLGVVLCILFCFNKGIYIYIYIY